MNQDNLTIQLPSFDGRVSSDISGDYILPDVYPDVKRILRVSAKSMLIERYVSGKRLEFVGAVDYTVVFSAETQSGESLQSVHFAGDFNGAVTDGENLDSAEILIETKIASCTARLSNPRKVSLKSTVHTDVRIARMCPTEPHIDGDAGEGHRHESLVQTVSSLREKMITLEPILCSENLELDASLPPIDEIVTLKTVIHFNEARPVIEYGAMNVNLKGDACLECVYKALDGSWRSFRRKTPLSYTLEAQDCASFFEGCAIQTLCAFASSDVTEQNALVSENSYGERRIIELDFTHEPKLHLTGLCEVPITLDAYCTHHTSECIMKDIEFGCCAKALSTNFSVGESLPKSDYTLPEVCTLIDSAGDVEIRSAAIDKGRAVLSGEATISCIFQNSDGLHFSCEPTIPVKCELPCTDLEEPAVFKSKALLSDIRLRLDGDRIYLDFEVCVNLLLRGRKRIQTVSSLKLGPPIANNKQGAGLIVCYPDKNESLWQIARRYNVTVAALEAVNKDAKNVILIPRNHGISGVI